METDVYNYLGAYIRYARLEKQISLRDLANRIGVSASYLSDVELGKRNMTDDHKLHKIAQELGLSIHGLFVRAEKVPDEILRAYMHKPLQVYDFCIKILKEGPK